VWWYLFENCTKRPDLKRPPDDARNKHQKVAVALRHFGVDLMIDASHRSSLVVVRSVDDEFTIGCRRCLIFCHNQTTNRFYFQHRHTSRY